MNRSVSEALRRLVSTRAENLCEYCLIDIADTLFGGEVDHIVSVKHGGATEAENLAYTCQPCNRNKGSDLGSIYWPSGQLVRFFNPRTDQQVKAIRVGDELIVDLAPDGTIYGIEILNANA
jgi:uncharacterized protein YuzE